MPKTSDDAPERLDPGTLVLPWHDPAWRRVTSQLEAGRLAHALLVTGLPGLGKDLFAERLAMRILCESPRGADACGACRACGQFVARTHPDHHVVTLREDKTQIVIDQVREELVEPLQLSSHHGHAKVAVLTPADRMNRNAFNALLKTLEEPSGKSFLILVSAHPARLAATIRSRCQQVPIVPPPRREAEDWLAARGVREPALPLALSGGAPLAAAQLAGSELLTARPKLLRALLDLVDGRGDVAGVAQAWAAQPFAAAVSWLMSVVHDLIRLRQLGPEADLVNDDLRRDLQSGAHRLDWRSMHRHLDELVRLRALTETPVVAQLQWEGVMAAWSVRLDPAALR